MPLELNSIPMTNLTMIKHLSMVSHLTMVLKTIPLSNTIMVINLRIVYVHNTNPMSNFTMVIYLTTVLLSKMRPETRPETRTKNSKTRSPEKPENRRPVTTIVGLHQQHQICVGFLLPRNDSRFLHLQGRTRSQLME